VDEVVVFVVSNDGRGGHVYDHDHVTVVIRHNTSN
jgi:hypothetical protein